MVISGLLPRRTASLSLLLALLSLSLDDSSSYTPACLDNNDCNLPRNCFTCDPAEFEIYSNGYGGFPLSAKCSSIVSNCLYCWKGLEQVVLGDGWSSTFQYRSCVPWPTAVACNSDTCPSEYAYYKVDHCITKTMQKTASACSIGGWCSKTVTDCVCSGEKCNLGTRMMQHNLVTVLLTTSFVALVVRKCFQG
ncbi:hypothetical protein GUITHDRAFT_166248 [Guillardia theta CCMP2712]|uniref:Uncharacterized protein n=2 Tax=Guillardia theta TaxID=55529 RepID=L1IE30_GUITC|nr:hypothetical protein GUITHDRAFT_166248 [Guillardia theta CCMP2712]EKX34337.1 hypothetical protein GUITHDRAFT_166248 [Guillardia theta CCMP2712]|mmetsp:Transcript_32604/g.103242  ORF Transcript_32604/g.103242 Transcript_32604/m.103242 type:complete len:193 (+) Transcript_32604:79-657(+)|eukprot:XP_005821317.1 hypothetical protein GUITHDRAFT_166248 [Guillardia theta CCMP2712]